MTDGRIGSFMQLVNTEVEHGTVAADALLGAAAPMRASLLAAHPEWLRLGTFDVMLCDARDCLERDARAAEELTAFIVAHVDLITPPPGGEVFHDIVRGTAYKDHATALYRRRQHPEAALAAADRAITILSARPALAVERASAQLVKAQIWQQLGQLDAALELLDEAERVFAESGDAQKYVHALIARGHCYFDRAETAESSAARAFYYREADRAFAEAEQEAARIGDARECARLRNNRGHCALGLHRVDDAAAAFTDAIQRLTELGMFTEAPRAAWGLAETIRRRGEPGTAIEGLRDACRNFIARGLPVAAASVLLDLVAVVNQSGTVPGKAIVEELALDIQTQGLPVEVTVAVAAITRGGRPMETTDITEVQQQLEAFYSSSSATTAPV